MGLNLHLFHGFLGKPQDWSGVLNELNPGDFEVFSHDLLRDCFENPKIDSFDSWVEYKEAELSRLKNKNLIVGYSLGGRLALHLDPSLYEKLFLVGTHMGLEKGREARLASDMKWIEKFETEGVESWLAAWNSQEVFQADRNRPIRDYSQAEWETWLKILSYFSLGRQEPQRKRLLENKSQLFWACGANDQKFLKLKGSWSDVLDEGHCFEIANSGHGVLFDNPKALAAKVIEVFEYV